MHFIILTKSSKNGKYCVAGIDASNGNWVRLVTDDVVTDGAVSDEDLACIDGRTAQIMDEIEIDVEPDPTPIQPENMRIISRNGLPKFIRQYNLEMVLRIHPAERERYVFFTKYRSIKPEYIIHPEYPRYPKSLMLIAANNLVVGQDHQRKASFDYEGISYEDISVTDPDTYPMINSGKVIRKPNAYLVVSLGKPYPPDSEDPRCYKFVAKIFL